METFAILMVFASLIAGIYGLINLAKPLGFMKITKRRHGAALFGAAFISFWVFAIVGASSQPGGLSTQTATEVAASADETDKPAALVDTKTESQPAPQVEQAPRLTGPQRNAVRSANQYLSMMGFSRSGLIKQLSSDYGDGYAVADATVAVDSLDVDWNANAARSAEQYLSLSGFSCNGLIDQLSSSAGDGYTRSQAQHGAQAAGAC